MNILLLPDSFKGTLSSIEVCQIEKEEIQKIYPSFSLSAFPFSDGGEDCLSCFQYGLKGYEEVKTEVTSSHLKEKTNASYLIYQNKAIIESASAMGLYKTKEKNPLLTTTYGVGELISNAYERGIRDFIITLGGSSTNDGGAGMLSALRCSFLNKNGIPFIPTGGNLSEIEKIEEKDSFQKYLNCHFTLLCDVINPLLGEKGSTFTFAPQKGASKKDLPLLEQNMIHYSKRIAELTHQNLSSAPYSGACGGLTYGFLSFFHCDILAGAEAIYSLYNIEKILKNTDVIITGEGKTDFSSFDGKVISFLIKKAKEKRIPLIILSGFVDQKAKERLSNMKIEDVISINKYPDRLFEDIKKHAKEDLQKAIQTELCSILSKY